MVAMLRFVLTAKTELRHHGVSGLARAEPLDMNGWLAAIVAIGVVLIVLGATRRMRRLKRAKGSGEKARWIDTSSAKWSGAASWLRRNSVKDICQPPPDHW